MLCSEVSAVFYFVLYYDQQTLKFTFTLPFIVIDFFLNN
jgi:hypothetical protein